WTTTNTRANPTLHQLLLPGQPQPPRRPPAVIDLTIDSLPHAQETRQRAPEMQRHPEIIDVDALPDRPTSTRTLPTLHPPPQTHTHFQVNYNPHYDARHTLGGRVGDRSYSLPAPHFAFGQPMHASAH